MGNWFGKLLAGFVGALLAAAFGVPLVGMLARPFGLDLEPNILIVAVALIATMILLALSAGRPAKAWRRVLIVAGGLSLCLSATHLFIGSGSSTGPESSDFVSVMAFFVGVVLLLIGLLVGRDQSIYTDR